MPRLCLLHSVLCANTPKQCGANSLPSLHGRQFRAQVPVPFVPTPLRVRGLENARRSYKNAIQWFEEISTSSSIALAKLNLALVYEKDGEYEQALQLYFEALALSEQVANKGLIATVCLNLGLLYSKKARD